MQATVTKAAKQGKPSLKQQQNLRKSRILHYIKMLPVDERLRIETMAKKLHSTWNTSKKDLDEMVADGTLVYDKLSSNYSVPTKPVEPVQLDAPIESTKVDLGELANEYLASQRVRLEDMEKLSFLDDFIKFVSNK